MAANICLLPAPRHHPPVPSGAQAITHPLLPLCRHQVGIDLPPCGQSGAASASPVPSRANQGLVRSNARTTPRAHIWNRRMAVPPTHTPKAAVATCDCNYQGAITIRSGLAGVGLAWVGRSLWKKESEKRRVTSEKRKNKIYNGRIPNQPTAIYWYPGLAYRACLAHPATKWMDMDDINAGLVPKPAGAGWFSRRRECLGFCWSHWLFGRPAWLVWLFGRTGLVDRLIGHTTAQARLGHAIHPSIHLARADRGC